MQPARFNRPRCRWGFCSHILRLDPVYDEKYKAKERHPSWHKARACMLGVGGERSLGR